MAASTNDLLKKSGASTVTTLSAPGKALGATSINVGSTTNYPTDTGIVIAIRQVDSNGDLVAGTYTEWSATVASATSLSIVATPVYGSDQIYAAGSTTQVYIPLSSYAHNKLIDNILEHANQDGSLITQAVRDALNLDSGSSDGWTPFGYSLTSITALGNRSYTAVVSGVDTTGTTSVGMRLKLPRTVTAPTGSITLNGTTQYGSKSSPSGMAQTDSITESIWINPDQYKTAGLISRNNGTTDGWKFYLNSSGQIILAGARAGDDLVTSYQSVPLNKWTHVSASINTTTTTGVITIDGKSVPVSYTNNANTGFAAPTQSYLIGATNGASPTDFFSGQLAQSASYSAVISVATILASMNQTLTGSETSLISAHKLDQASGLNDLSANANNLTANGSPTYSTTKTPFTNSVTGTSVTAGTTNYGIIMAQTFSTNTTYTISIPEGETLPTTGGIGTVSYSTQKTPYGFPGQRGKWTLSLCMGARASTSAGIAANTVTNPGGINLSLPVGEWSLGYQMGAVDSASGPVAYLAFAAGLSTSASSISDYELMSQSVLTNSSNNQVQSYLVKSKQINSTTSTPWYFVVKPLTATVTHTLFTGYDASLSSDIGLITAENSLL